MAIKDLAELIKKFTQKDKFKPTTVQVIRAAKNPPVPAQNEDISVPSEGERIHFLNTGRSDCILLQSESKFALVDCGDAEHAKHTARYLKETAGGKINLDFIAITHLHSGHVGGLGTLLDDGDITIGKIYLKPFISPNLAQWDKCLHDGDALYKSLSEKAQSMNIPVIGCVPDEPFALGSWTLRFFNTEPDSYHKNIGENDNSLAILAEQNGRRILLAGDMVNDTGDLARLANAIGRIDALKVPCHGERAVPQEALDKLRPEMMIITNRLAEISDDVLVGIMSAFGRKAYSTSDSGGIALTLTHDGLEVSREIQLRETA